jgi:hypothetical protein
VTTLDSPIVRLRTQVKKLNLQSLLATSLSITLAISTSLISISSAHAAAPTVTSMAFTADSVTGGTLDTITGTNLLGAISVTVGGVSAVLGNNTSTSLEFVIPTGSVGIQPVVVTTSGGSVTSAFSITYYATLTPACGISGSFTIDRNNTVISNTACKGLAVIPNGVKTIGANAFVSNSNLFSIDIPSTVTTFGASNNYGPFRNSWLTGVTFQPNSQLTTIQSGAFRSTPYLQYVSLPKSVTTMQVLSFSDYVSTNGLRWIEIPETVTSIDMSLPYGAIDNYVPLTCIVSPVGSTGRTLSGHFTTGTTNSTVGAATPIFVTSVMDCPAPTITSFSSTQGSANGGVSLTISGTNLWNVNNVTIGGASAQITSLPNANSITVLTPPGTVGAQDVVLSTPGPSVTSVAGYAYLTPPTATSISVATSVISGGGTTVITGTNLASLTSSTIGGVAAVRSANTSTSVTLTIPAGTVGTKDVVLTNLNGTVTMVGAFTYYELVSSFINFALINPTMSVDLRTSVLITATVTYASKITFKYGNTRIAGCISMRTPATGPFTVTCTWRPTRKGAALLTATSVPISGGINSGFSSPISMSVNSRSTTR